ncbi:MAG TPA: GAF and ANTAR domain-containing protein [Geodermatophilus sp.]|nr:GAF and ANTAR domain-containing protein [Geodermatophilus sp.]
MSAPGSDPMSQGADLSAALGGLSGLLYAEETLGSVLGLVTTLAAEVLPGSCGAGVTLLTGRMRTTAATDPAVERADALQYELGEGPCLSAAQDRRTYRIDSMRSERRWPRWTERAAQLGLGSSLSSPLVVRHDSIGTVKVYAVPEAAFGDHAEQILGLFAEKASVTVADLLFHEDARRFTQQLRNALRSRDVIGQAKGILRERHRVDEQTAFGMLVQWSQHAKVTVRDLAEELLASTDPGPA